MAEPKITATIATSISALSLTAKLIVLGCLVIMGANAYAITAYREARKEKLEFRKLDYMHSFLGGIFSGSIFFLLSLLFFDNELIAWVGAGIGAFMGFSGITRAADMLINIVEDRIKKK